MSGKRKMIYFEGKEKQNARVVMEAFIGRPLLPWPLEIVHHKDGDPSNDNLSNLEIMSLSEHARLHHTGKVLSEETKRKVSAFGMSEERKRKISAAHTGKILTEEHKQKLSIAGKGRIVSEETRQKLSKISKGKTLSEETKKKISASRIKFLRGTNG